jgi:glutamate/tyrosine decarboxylase-like PLP-dependent enzyme
MGRAGLIDLIERDSAMARRLAEHMSAAPAARVLNDVVLNQVLVRFDAADVTDDDAADARTRAIIAEVQRDGTAWLGGTIWEGHAAMRFSVSGWQTSEDDIDRTAAVIIDAAERLR